MNWFGFFIFLAIVLPGNIFIWMLQLKDEKERKEREEKRKKQKEREKNAKFF